jgi:hypothetical protein
MALLPNYRNAFIAIEKLEEYCLNPFHPTGKNKALVFKSVFGFTQEDAEFLRENILNEISKNDAIYDRVDEFGQRFTVDIKIRILDVKNVIRTNWIIKNSEDFPRLITCYVK